MCNLHLCNAATIRYSQLKFGHMHLCGMDYKCFAPHCCKCNSFGCTAAIRCGNACHGPHSDSLYSGSEDSQFNSPRLVKREAGFPKPRWALIGSNHGSNYDALMTHHTTENSLLPGRRQAIIWTNDGILLIGPLGTNFSENLNRNLNIFIKKHAFENVVWKMAAILSRPQCVNTLRPDDKYLCQQTRSSLV